eukprot:1194831-Prorocentrum_minimum.AAC.5
MERFTITGRVFWPSEDAKGPQHRLQAANRDVHFVKGVPGSTKRVCLVPARAPARAPPPARGFSIPPPAAAASAPSPLRCARSPLAPPPRRSRTQPADSSGSRVMRRASRAANPLLPKGTAGSSCEYAKRLARPSTALSIQKLSLGILYFTLQSEALPGNLVSALSNQKLSLGILYPHSPIRSSPWESCTRTLQSEDLPLTERAAYRSTSTRAGVSCVHAKRKGRHPQL